MIARYPLLWLLLFSGLAVSAQKKNDNDNDNDKRDTTQLLHPVIVRGYLSQQPMLSVPASVSVLTAEQIKLQPENSLVSTMNTVPGVRMEERTPGSYRLSIRGSLLRSPFGVRDVKIYMDDFPFTDAGGNTYLNTIDFNSVKGVEVLKGPDGSLFGANSGGVVIINTDDHYTDSAYLAAGVNAGSYGLVHQQAEVNLAGFSFNQAYETYDGYRDHSYMRRTYLQAKNDWQYAPNSTLRFFAVYSDLKYQTPGGLTMAQYMADPQAARPPTATLPGAIQQQIGIATKIFYRGLSNNWQITPRLKNVLTVFSNRVDFANPFITNYEQRVEKSMGMRTYLEWSSKKYLYYNWKGDIGLEVQKTQSDIDNYDNHAGEKGAMQTGDDINTHQYFFFARYVGDFWKKLHAEAGASLNYYGYDFKNNYPLKQAAFTNRDFTPEVMPRVALSYQLTNNFVWRASVSRGYSAPTTAEVRPTDNVINTALNPQDGVNYETGFRLRDQFERFMLDASVFYYRIGNAIVRELHPDETEYYINAGGTRQPGVEVYGSAWLISPQRSGLVRGVQLNESLTLSKFTFTNYTVAGANYSGNKLTGVPAQVSITGLQLLLANEVTIYGQYNYTSSLPLNDANTAYARRYHLVQAKASWQWISKIYTFRMNFYAGADNLLNQHYSLGDDLNAVGNRYYNPAPMRNYYIGVNFVI